MVERWGSSTKVRELKKKTSDKTVETMSKEKVEGREQLRTESLKSTAAEANTERSKHMLHGERCSPSFLMFPCILKMPLIT